MLMSKTRGRTNTGSNKAQSQVNDEQILVISQACPPQAAAKERNESEAAAARRPTDDNKERYLTIKAAEDEAISFFKGEYGKIGDDHASRDELMTTLAETPSALQFPNKMEEILASHNTQLDSKLENVYDPDTVQVIQNEWTADALKGMQDLLGELRKQLECRDRLLARVNANCERLEREISAFMFETERDFKRALLDSSKLCSEDELAQVELDSRSKAMEELKKFCHQVPETTKSSLRADLIARLDHTSEKARKEFRNNEVIVKEQLDAAIKEAAAEYKRSMVGFVLSESGAIAMEANCLVSSTISTNIAELVFTTDQMPPIASQHLENFHRKSQAKASTMLSNFLDTNKKKFKNLTHNAQESRDTLEELISETFSHFLRLAHKKREWVQAQALKKMAKAEQELTKEMKTLVNRAEDEELFDLEASFCIRQAKSQLEASIIDFSVKSENVIQDILSQWDTTAEQLLSLCRTLSRKQCQQKMEKLKAKNNMSKGEEEIRAEMEKLFNNRPDEQTFDMRASYLQNRLTIKLQNSMDASIMGAQSVEEIMSSWNCRVQELIRQYKVTVRNQIQQRFESAKAQAYRDSANFEQNFRTEMEKLLNNGTDERAFNREAHVVKNRFRMELENSMDVSSMGLQSVQEIMSEWDLKVQVAISDYKALLVQIEPDKRKKAQAVEDEPQTKAFEQEHRAKAIKEEHQAKTIEDERQAQAIEGEREAQAIEDEREAQAIEDERRRAEAIIEDERRRAQEIEDERRAKAIEDERRQAQAIEDERRRAEAIEDERRRAEAIEDERRRAEAIEDERRRAQAIEDERRRAQTIENERRRGQAIENERRSKNEPGRSKGKTTAATSRTKKRKPITFFSTLKDATRTSLMGRAMWPGSSSESD